MRQLWDWIVRVKDAVEIYIALAAGGVVLGLVMSIISHPGFWLPVSTFIAVFSVARYLRLTHESQEAVARREADEKAKELDASRGEVDKIYKRLLFVTTANWESYLDNSVGKRGFIKVMDDVNVMRQKFMDGGYDVPDPCTFSRSSMMDWREFVQKVREDLG